MDNFPIPKNPKDFKKSFEILSADGVITFKIIIPTMNNIQMKMVDIKSQMESELAGNPFLGLADIAMQAVQLQWGWVFFIFGSGLAIASAAMKDER